MAKLLGLNALVYVGGTEAPQRNTWTLNVSRELQEARVFSDIGAGEGWVENVGGFRSWSGSVNGFYDDADETLVSTAIGGTAGRHSLHLYEDRGTLTHYWYGEAWFDISEDVGVDGFAELNADFTGDGQLYRFTA